MPRSLPPLHLLLLLATLGGWATPTSAKTLRIGVPAKSPYPQYVDVKCKTLNETCFSGHAIDVFRLVWKNLYNNSDYEFIPCEGHYDTLIDRVFYKKLDAVVGDTSIMFNRTQYIEYSRPYTETGARMVVLEKREVKAWIFVKPFTGTLWVSTGAIFFYNGIIVWLIESTDDEEKCFSFNHICNLIWLSFTTLFPNIHEKKLRSNLSKMAMVVWLFVALILIQSYSASLTSMLTVSQLRPSVVDVNSLLKAKAKVGCDKSSFMSKYLEKVVGFGAGCVATYNSDEYAQALSTGAIKAAFLEIPSIQLFLDKNNGFTVTGRTYEIGGFAFIFQKGSDHVQNVSNEILKLRENGTLRKLEEKLLSSHKRSSVEANDHENDRLSLDSFWGLFVITGGMSTLALLLFLVGRFLDNWQCRYCPWIRSVGRSVELISRSRRIHNNDDQSPDSAVVELRGFKRCNTV